MRILLDECVPRPLRNELPGHEVRTVRQMGWLGIENGDLLRLAGTLAESEQSAGKQETEQRMCYN